MNPNEINQTFDLLAHVSNHTNIRKAGSGWWNAPCPFPRCSSDKDGFILKATSDGYRWICNSCGDGKYHTAIDYIMRLDNLSFKDTLHKMGGDVQNGKPNSRSLNVHPPKLPSITLPDKNKQMEMLKAVATFSNRLSSKEEGQAGRDYLTGRGIMPWVWDLARLGFGNIYDPKMRRKRAAVSFPYWDCYAGWFGDYTKTLVTAIKYRFIDNVPNGMRYRWHGGDTPFLYGLWDAMPRFHQTILFLEGEINGLSAWQCRPEDVTVISFGSETGGLGKMSKITKRMASQYERVFVWCDEQERAKQYKQLLPKAITLISPKGIAGIEKWDANEMLMHEVLAKNITYTLGVECQGKIS